MKMIPLAEEDLVLSRYLGGAPCSPPRYVHDDLDTEFSFSRYWVPNVKASYSIVASGDSMTGAHIFDGDMLVVDCSEEPENGRVVVAWLNGDLTVKKLKVVPEGVVLCAANPNFENIHVKKSDDFKILGVVTSVHRHL